MTRKHYRGERLILHNFSYQELACADFQDAILIFTMCGESPGAMGGV